MPTTDHFQSHRRADWHFLDLGAVTDEISRLRKQLADVERERDEWRHAAEQHAYEWRVGVERTDALQAQLAALRAPSAAALRAASDVIYEELGVNLGEGKVHRILYYAIDAAGGEE